jgi:hypothetical protein
MYRHRVIIEQVGKPSVVLKRELQPFMVTHKVQVVLSRFVEPPQPDVSGASFKISPLLAFGPNLPAIRPQAGFTLLPIPALDLPSANNEDALDARFRK